MKRIDKNNLDSEYSFIIGESGGLYMILNSISNEMELNLM
jgi:hypothetical protein